MTTAVHAVLWFHILAGGIALVAGLCNVVIGNKGSRVHVGVGRWFWYSMIAMGASGVVLAIAKPKAGFVLIGLLSLYLVNTGRNALRHQHGGSSGFWFVVAASCLVAGMAIGAYGLFLGEAVFGSPPALYLGAAFDAAIFVALDLRQMLAPRASRNSRIVEHAWRMIAALLFATFALFVANPSLFPGWVRALGINYAPPLAVFAALAYWVLAVQRGWWRRT